MFNNFLLLITVLALSTLSLGLGLSEQCQYDSQCTDLHSTCRLYTCKISRCLCKVGYTMTLGLYKTCRKQSLLGQPCESSVECSAKYSICNASNICECEQKSRPSRDKLRCYSAAANDLGDVCESRDYCGINAECVDNKCACREGNIPWTSPEMWTWMRETNIKPCQRLKYYLGSCDGSPNTTHNAGPPSAAASIHNNNAISWVYQTLSRLVFDMTSLLEIVQARQCRAKITPTGSTPKSCQDNSYSCNAKAVPR